MFSYFERLGKVHRRELDIEEHQKWKQKNYAIHLASIHRALQELAGKIDQIYLKQLKSLPEGAVRPHFEIYFHSSDFDQTVKILLIEPSIHRLGVPMVREVVTTLLASEIIHLSDKDLRRRIDESFGKDAKDPVEQTIYHADNHRQGYALYRGSDQAPVIMK